MPEPTVRATTYAVSCLPLDDEDAHLFTITVEYRGNGQWGVFRNGRGCLGSDGQWDWEPLPSNRDDDWLVSHRFAFDTAIELAKQHAPLITVNGYTVADALRRKP
jgi:hypothetical protein